MEELKTYKKGNKTLKIYQDSDPADPREWDNIGIMICLHNKYNLGDKTDLKSDYFNDWDEVRDYIKKEHKGICIIPLRLYDHSGISMSTSSEYPYNCRWDSGQVGFIYTTKKRLKEIGHKEMPSEKKIKGWLEGEVETYNQYLTGDVYSYELIEEVPVKITREYADGKKEVQEVTEEKEIDSCFGFFGDEGIKFILSENGFTEKEEAEK